MDGDKLVSAIGKPQDAAEVQEILASVGVKKPLKMPQDDIEARVELPREGLSLIFKPEGPKTSRLVFHSVIFYSKSEHGYSSFSGKLPFDLNLADSQTHVHTKLRKPTDGVPRLRREIWKVDGLQLAIQYKKERPQEIANVTVGLPLARS
jgi:hypothetical protein